MVIAVVVVAAAAAAAAAAAVVVVVVVVVMVVVVLAGIRQTFMCKPQRESKLCSEECLEFSGGFCFCFFLGNYRSFIRYFWKMPESLRHFLQISKN